MAIAAPVSPTSKPEEKKDTMLDNGESKQERWQAVETVLQGWLKERREVLVKYAAIAATMDRSATDLTQEPGLHRLCQLLVDYVSAGHFEIFYQLIREAEAFDDGSGTFAADIIPQIGDTTEVIMGFDEKYSAADAAADHLDADLSLLGEVLESRFQLEDVLITALHKSHSSRG
jgi:regulator of sigma D